MKRFSSQAIVDNKYLVLLVLVLVVNTALLGLGYNVIREHLAIQEEELVHRQKFAHDLWDYNQRLAKDLGVHDRSTVRDALSRLTQEIELASVGDDLARAVLTHGRRVQETILREYEARQIERILAVVNHDTLVRLITGRKNISINASLEGGVLIDPPEVLLEATVVQIADIAFESEIVRNISVDITVEDGLGRIAVPFNPVEHIKALSAEIDSLRVALREVRSTAGLLEISGPGIIIEIYDAAEGFTTEAIIHDTDVRDVVNELFASGARGVSVGGQRLVATSAIRCVGPVVMVNDKHIAVNPVVIKALGDPVILESGIDIIRFSLESRRNLFFEIEQVDSLTLPAFAN